MKTGIEQITDERSKQITKHTYTVKNDSVYTHKELLCAALAYLVTAIYGSRMGLEDWPWWREMFKDEGDVENLKKAGALIAAELDRLNIS